LYKVEIKVQEQNRALFSNKSQIEQEHEQLKEKLRLIEEIINHSRLRQRSRIKVPRMPEHPDCYPNGEPLPHAAPGGPVGLDDETLSELDGIC
jgi:hypothetical protein